MKARIPHLWSLLESVPKNERPKGEEELNFWQTLAWELSQLLQYGAHAEQPEIVLSDMRQAGTQYIWEFWVNDLAVQKTGVINWHGQNTSQWQYAGAILLQDGKVSAHH